MTPVAWWMLHEETVYKGGDTVTLNETDLTQIPKVIEYCKKNPQKICIPSKIKHLMTCRINEVQVKGVAS